MNTEIYCLFVDADYPSMPWLVKYWPGNNLSPEKTIFNARQSSARMAIGQGFGLLDTHPGT